MPSKIIHVDTPERQTQSTAATTPTNVLTTPSTTIGMSESNIVVTPEEIAKYLSVQIVWVVDM